MIPETVREFIIRTGLALVASSDTQGRPHLAASRDLQIIDGEHVEFTAWFCRRTLENVAQNPQVTVAVIDALGEVGYQLSGRVEQVTDAALLNGFAQGMETPGIPQVESRLLVRVDGVMRFSSGPHTDRDLQSEV